MDPMVQRVAMAIRLRAEKERLGIPVDRDLVTLSSDLQQELRSRVMAQWRTDVPLAETTIAKLRYRRDLNAPLPGEVMPDDD
jgi:hypothetical protein